MTLDDLGLNAVRLIGGFCGSVVHIFTAKQFQPVALLGSVVIGTLTANFLGPAAQHYAPTWLGDYGSSFLVGYCAIIILQFVDMAVRAKLGMEVRQRGRDNDSII